jgi:hypothetical protein
LAAYVYSVVFRIHFRSSQKARKTFWQKRSFFEESFDAEGVPPLLAVSPEAPLKRRIYFWLARGPVFAKKQP